MKEDLYFIETMTFDLAKRLLEEEDARDIQSALDIIFESSLYDKICDEGTKLMYQNPGYVYTLLKSEKLKQISQS